jgi:hypothetical protein
MKAWDITIEGDEQGWQMHVRTEDCDSGPCDFSIFLPPDVGEQLHRWVKLEIDPWVQEKAEARAAHATRHPDWMPKKVKQAEAQEILDAGVYDDDPGKRIWAEGVARGEA